MAKGNEKYLISGDKGKWEVVIGLEVHAQVTSHFPFSPLIKYFSFSFTIIFPTIY